MTSLVWLAVFLFGSANSANASKPPHPAVVRVIAPSRTGASLGSGALVAVNLHHGLVLTNWHVVRDATGSVVVAFPDGFRSAASILRMDRDWDLAALAIQRPSVEPIRLSVSAPRPGEPLTIAGYGSGAYREVTGRCTQYVSPGGNKPFEMVELSAGARFGDSGGPILNQRGELAGVLFGSAFGQTTGSYCGRVRQFLSLVNSDFQRLQPNPAAIAGSPQSGNNAKDGHFAVAKPADPGVPVASRESPPSAIPRDSTASVPAVPRSPDAASWAADSSSRVLPEPPAASISPQIASETAEPRASPIDLGGGSLFDRIRNFLAAVGLCAILFLGLRLLSSAQQSA